MYFYIYNINRKIYSNVSVGSPAPPILFQEIKKVLMLFYVYFVKIFDKNNKPEVMTVNF